jgi:hypothetical protein
MKQYYPSSKSKSATSVVAIVGVAILVLLVAFVLVKAAVVGPGSTETNASRSTYLTPGDDGLSLQEDLRKLSEDPSLAEEELLNAY